MLPSQLQGHNDSDVEAHLQDAKNEVVGKDDVVEEMEDEAVVIQVVSDKVVVVELV